MNTQPLDRGMDAQFTVLETEALAQSGFTPEEIPSMLQLREWYQHGGSDRTNVVRYLEFLKFLIRNDRLQP